jgi:hypothetical protein
MKEGFTVSWKKRRERLREFVRFMKKSFTVSWKKEARDREMVYGLER